MLRKLLQRLARHAAERLVAEGGRAEAAGRFAEACERYQMALKYVPGHVPAYISLGIALEGGGDLRSAREAYRAALELDPENAYAHFNLGKLLHASGNPASQGDAERELRAALERKPDFIDARVMLASVLEERGDAQRATAMLEEAMREAPDHAGACYNYALLLHRLGRIAEAEAAMRRALELWPDRAEVWLRHGEILKLLERLPEAEAALRRALELDPSLSGAYRLLASVLVDQLRGAEASRVLADGRQHDPASHTRANELFLLNFDDRISAEALFERHREFGAEIEQLQLPRFQGFAGTRDPERALRIGFVSGDFCAHPVGWTFLPLIERLDRARYQAFCYSTFGSVDDVTRAIASRVTQWNNAAAAPARHLAAVIHSDRIDILLDLSGFGGIPTFEIMASKPAPVQASWLAYLSTCGMTRIDYRITDARADPPGEAERLHTEKLARLPHSLWCYRARTDAAPAEVQPRERNGFFTFGSFSQPARLSQTARRLWAEILRRTPGSRLLVVGVPPGPAAQALREDFARLGVDAGRVAVEPRLSAPEYFARLREVDLALDTMPASGGMTACDTLWMGTPVLTLAGDRSMSRSAAGILSVLGLDGWVATSPDDYVARAVAFAGGGRAERGLRDRMRASPLMDEAAFARAMEALLREMWRSYCATVKSS